MKFDELPDWTFEGREVSAGVFNVRAVHSSGASVDLTDSCNEELLLKRAKEDAASMQKELDQRRASQQAQYREIWIEKPDGQSMCALINGNVGWLMYLRKNGDPGFVSRNQDHAGDKSATVEYVLSNGQRDRYPASWALPLSVVERAMDYFEREGKPPPFVFWHNDSGDGARIDFFPDIPRS